MKRILATLVFCLVGAASLSQARVSLRLVCDDTADLRVAIECMLLLETRLPIDVEIVRMPWRRCLEVELRQGLADGAFLASYQAEREQYGAYPRLDGLLDSERRYNNAGYFFYRRRNSAVSWDGRTVAGLNRAIGAPRGYSVVQDLRAAGYTVEESDNTLADLRKLNAGRLDLVAAVEERADQLLVDYPELAASIEKVVIPYAVKPYFLMLSHQFIARQPLLAEQIWDAVRSIRLTEYRSIFHRFMDEPADE